MVRELAPADMRAGVQIIRTHMKSYMWPCMPPVIPGLGWVRETGGLLGLTGHQPCTGSVRDLIPGVRKRVTEQGAQHLLLDMYHIDLHKPCTVLQPHYTQREKPETVTNDKTGKMTVASCTKGCGD